MSAVELADPNSGRISSHVGEVFAAWRGGPGSLLLLGWQHERPPPEGMVALQRAGESRRGHFTRITWPVAMADIQAYRFLAAIHLPGAEVQDRDTLLLTGRRASDEGVLARLPPFLDPLAFGAGSSREPRHPMPGPSHQSKMSSRPFSHRSYGGID